MDIVSLKKGEVVSLSKGQVVSLTKENPGLDKVIVGLGWDPVDKGAAQPAKGFFGRLFGGGSSESHSESDIDCDAFAVALENGKLYRNRVLYFGEKSILSGALVHSGDNLTGEGEGDDEQLIVNLKSVPSNIDTIMVAVNIYRGRSRGQRFGNIKNAYIRLVDCKDNSEMCRYDLSNTSEYADYVTVHFGDLVRGSTGWEFKAVGAPSSTDSISEFSNKYV